MDIQLNKMINHKVIVLGSSLFPQDKLQTVTLLGVEPTGIWIQSDEAAAGLIEKYRVAPSAPGLAFFIPFGQITSILAGVEPNSPA
jgi:hypothetical protein